MSLKFFHRVFIAAAFLCLGFAARWASGHNAAALTTPLVFYASAAGMILLAVYSVWNLKKLG